MPFSVHRPKRRGLAKMNSRGGREGQLADTVVAQGGFVWLVPHIHRGGRIYNCNGDPPGYGPGDGDVVVGHGLGGAMSTAGEQSHLSDAAVRGRAGDPSAGGGLVGGDARHGRESRTRA